MSAPFGGKPLRRDADLLEALKTIAAPDEVDLVSVSDSAIRGMLYASIRVAKDALENAASPEDEPSRALQGIAAGGERAPTAAERFTLWAIQNSIFEGGSIDWLDAQCKAEQLGLIISEEYDRDRHGGQGGDYDPGDQIFVLSNEMRDVGKRVKGLP